MIDDKGSKRKIIMVISDPLCIRKLNLKNTQNCTCLFNDSFISNICINYAIFIPP